MKSKKISLLVAAMHVVVLAGFSLLQGCATGSCPVDWLNWPYNTPADEPVLVPVDDFGDDSILLPPAVYPAEPVVGTDYAEPVEMLSGPAETYIVRKGDTLSSIASMYGTTWKKLAEYNSLSNPNKLLVGQEIKIPGGSVSAPVPVNRPSTPAKIAPSSSSTRSPIKQGGSYVIQRGDSLSNIASRSGLTVNEIKAANALDSNRIVAGKSLSIPRKGEVSVSAYSTAPSVAPAPAPAPVTVAPEPAPLADIAPLEPADSAPIYEHVLYPGETLEDVARQYGSSKDEIMMLNGITSADSVNPGTKLLVPIPE